jgi:hypothetical protein
VVIVVPFAQVQHETESYKDYWRFTPSCMRELFRRNSMEVIYEGESCHKNAAVYLLFVASRRADHWRARMPAFRPVSDAGRWIGYHWSIRIYTALRRRLRRMQ